ncbi:MAG: hypothetical protein WC306_00810 [Candidatus Paceibacterota bacterium]|jgi:hypothetical protein
MLNRKTYFIVIGLISSIIFIYNLIPSQIEGADITVSATVGETISCTSVQTVTAFGTLTTAAVATSTPNVTVSMSCSYAAGCTLSVKDTGDTSDPGLFSTAATYTIPSVTAALSAGTEGYGIQATTTASDSGDTLTIAGVYNKIGDNVGALAITDVDISSSTAPISGRETVVTHKAAISGLTEAAVDYADTITYSCAGN